MVWGMTGWDRIGDSDASNGWQIQGRPGQRWLRKLFGDVAAVIRVVRADGTLRVTYGTAGGQLLISGGDCAPETSVAGAKATAERGWTTAHFRLIAMRNQEQAEHREAEQ